MNYGEYEITGNCLIELDTELRFEAAKAKVEKSELIALKIKNRESEKEQKRILSCVCIILRSLKKQSAIQFFVTPQGFLDNTMESQFLINKYGALNEGLDPAFSYIYVKL